MVKNRNKEIERAIKELNKLNSDGELRRLVELKQKAELDERSYRQYMADKGREEGLAQGMEEGLARGMKQGIEQGIEQGKKEMVKKMKEENIKIEVIQKITGLTRKEIENIN